ncbi:MAG: hypothetical protein ACXVFL_03750 [Solirubrobacteraceae bacterium]
MSRPLVLLAALREGEEEAARVAVAALGEPFARIPGTHQARVQVLRPPARRWRGRPQPYLLVAAEHDGPPEPWLAALATELDAVLAHCAFWPGPANPAEVVLWARDRLVHVGFSVVATDATVHEIGAALELHASVRELVAARRAP